MRYNQKRARKSSERIELWIFIPHFSKFRAFRTLQPPKRHVVLEFLAENKAFHFSKRALRAGTSRNKWLKKALLKVHSHLISFVTCFSSTNNTSLKMVAVHI